MVLNVESSVPDVKEKDWRLVINGRVENPVDLGIKQLKSDFEQESVETNILCLRGVTIKGQWSGVALKKILEVAQVRRDASWIQAKAYSDYAEPVRFDDAKQDGVIVAHSLDGETIPKKQGGLLRLVVPEKYAYKSVKWINELTVLSERPDGFWEKKGYPYKDQPNSV